jgi:hypothetical protein
MRMIVNAQIAPTPPYTVPDASDILTLLLSQQSCGKECCDSAAPPGILQLLSRLP